MSTSISAKTKKYSIASAILALILLAFQFIPYWSCSTEVFEQTGGAVVETPYGYWKYTDGEVPRELKAGFQLKEETPAEEAKTEKAEEKKEAKGQTYAEKLAAEGAKAKSKYSVIEYVWNDFRSTALIQSLSLQCGQVINFSSILTFCSLILLSTILTIIFSLAMPKSILSAVVGDLCGTIGLVVILLIPAVTASFTAAWWVIQLVVSLALKVLAVAKYVLWARRNEEG